MNDAFDSPRSGRSKSFENKVSWVPPHMEGSFTGHLLPPSVAPRHEYSQHYTPGTKGMACEVCSTQGFAYCSVYKGLKARAEAQGKDPKLTRPGSRIIVPFYGIKSYLDKKDGQVKDTKPRHFGIELSWGSYYSALKTKDMSLGSTCKSCGTRKGISHVKYVCNACSTDVTWPIQDQKEGKKPVCPKCRKVTAFHEVIKCSGCNNPKRLSVFDTQVTISKAADASVDFEFETAPIVPPPESALATPPFTMDSLVPFVPEWEMLEKLGLTAGASSKEPEQRGEPASQTTSKIADDDIPF